VARFSVLLVLWPVQGADSNCLGNCPGYSGKPDTRNAIDASRRDIQQGGMISIAYKKSKFSWLWQFRWLVLEETWIRPNANESCWFLRGWSGAVKKALTSVLEPIMIVVLGGMVGIILLSMYLPMFKVYDTSWLSWGSKRIAYLFRLLSFVLEGWMTNDVGASASQRVGRMTNDNQRLNYEC